MKKSTNSEIIATRVGCKDVWNAFMAKGATFGPYDIPFCPTTATDIPTAIVTWEEALHILKTNKTINDEKFFYNAFVSFYIDDYKFDGPRGVWHDAEHTLRVLRHFAGAITPDFSTYQDFPEPIKLFATYRMRLLGYWLGKNGIPIINNVRWGTTESFSYSFCGIPKNSVVAIGSVGGSPRKIIDRNRFETGLDYLVKELHPHTIIVCGSANYPCFQKLISQGIKIVSFPGPTDLAFKRRRVK